MSEDVIPPPVQKMRACLRCDKVFLSWGRANRLCQACRESLNALPTPEEEHTVVLHPLT